MDTYTVSFFGHRVIERAVYVEKRLEILLTDLIKQKDYIEFLVGRDGEFDQIVSSTVRKTVRKVGFGNTSLVLVLPYMRADYRDNKESFLDYYNEVEICEKAAAAYHTAAFGIRNRYMIDRSDLVVCCVEKSFGGAYSAMKYAKKAGKQTINLFDGE